MTGVQTCALPIYLIQKYELKELDPKNIEEKISNSRLPYKNPKDALVAVAEKHLSPTSYLKTLYPGFKTEERKKTSSKITKKEKQLLSGIHSVFASCCKPKIGDDLVGYIGKEHVIKIHKRTCKHLKKADQSRFIDIKN